WQTTMRQEIHCKTATTKRDLDDAARVRWEVFIQEKDYLRDRGPRVSRELDRMDTLESTQHIVAYVEREAVGTARLLFCNPDIPPANDVQFGIDLESKFDLSVFRRPGIILAETTRVCVLSGHRRAGVFERLYESLLRASLAAGVTHWVAAANTETDSLT